MSTKPGQSQNRNGRLLLLTCAILLSTWLSLDNPLSGGGLDGSFGSVPFALAFFFAVVSMPTSVGIAACGLYGVAWFLDFSAFHHARVNSAGLYTAWVLPCLIVMGFELMARRLASRDHRSLMSLASGLLGAALVYKMFIDASTDYRGVFELSGSGWVFAIPCGLALWAIPITFRLALIATFLVFYVSDIITFGLHVFLTSLVPTGAFDMTSRPTAHDRRALLSREEFLDAIGFLMAILGGLLVLAVRAGLWLRTRQLAKATH